MRYKTIMKENSFSIEFDNSIDTVFVRMFGALTSKVVQICFHEYEKIIEQNFKNKKFKILLNMDEEAHNSIEILKLVRSLMENQKYKENIIAYAGVCKNRSITPGRDYVNHNPREGFFDNEKSAIEFLSGKSKNITN